MKGRPSAQRAPEARVSEQLEAAVTGLEDADLRIAVVHHPPDMMDPDGANWTYLFQDLPTDRSAYQEYLQTIAASNDPLFHAIVDARTGEAVGMAALMRIGSAARGCVIALVGHGG